MDTIEHIIRRIIREELARLPVAAAAPATVPARLQWLSVADLSELLGVTTDTVYNWRAQTRPGGNAGPPSVKVGKYVRYNRADVEKWLRDRTS